MTRTLQPITRWFFAHARGRVLLAVTLPTAGLYATMLVVTLPNLERFSGGLKILDMQPLGYTREYAQALFDALGSAGRNYYLFRQIPLDMFYPGLYATAGGLLIAWLIRCLFAETSRYRWVVFLPIAAGLFDYLENIGIIIMLNSYPDLSLAGVTNVASLLKSLFTTLFFILLLVGAAAALVTRLRRRTAQ